MGTTTRLMPGFDPNWRDRMEQAAARQIALLDLDRPLNEAENRDLVECRRDMNAAADARFRTTAEYRDFHFARARAWLDAEGIDMPLPLVADDATREEIDRVLSMVVDAVEVTNSETF